MEEFILDSDILRFSKHYLINGWGLAQQERSKHMKVKYPPSWTLFRSYLCAMGNLDHDSTAFDLVCTLDINSTDDINAPFMLSVSHIDDLVVTLLDKEKRGNRRWNYFTPGFREPSDHYIQMACFHALTDGIKRDLV